MTEHAAPTTIRARVLSLSGSTNAGSCEPRTPITPPLPPPPPLGRPSPPSPDSRSALPSPDHTSPSSDPRSHLPSLLRLSVDPLLPPPTPDHPSPPSSDSWSTLPSLLRPPITPALPPPILGRPSPLPPQPLSRPALPSLLLSFLSVSPSLTHAFSRSHSLASRSSGITLSGSLCLSS